MMNCNETSTEKQMWLNGIRKGKYVTKTINLKYLGKNVNFVIIYSSSRYVICIIIIMWNNYIYILLFYYYTDFHIIFIILI